MEQKYFRINSQYYASKIIYHCLILFLSFGLLLLGLLVKGQQTYSFEKLGEPLHSPSTPITMVTTGLQPMAWTVIESPVFDVFGIEINSGKTVKLNLGKYRRTSKNGGLGWTSIRMHLSSTGNIYIFYGGPAHFFKYDVIRGQLIDLGQAASDGYYHLGGGQAIGPDGKMWVGSCPDSELSWVDPATDKIGTFGRIAEDIKEKYIMRTQVSDDNIVYCAVGLHHAELWAVNPGSGSKKQILPEDLTRKQGFVELYLGNDGKVYGSSEGRFWRCSPEGIDFVDKLPTQRSQGYNNTFKGERFTTINGKGELIAQRIDNSSQRSIPTDFIVPSKEIFNLGPVINGKIYGAGYIGRPTLFTYDLVSSKLTDLGVEGAGKTQIYDILGLKRGVFFTSYSEGGIDIYDPASGKLTPVAQLNSEKYQQERLSQLCLGSDGMIYICTTPTKGILGGALVKVNPNDLSVKVWRNIIPEQSLQSVVTVPATKEVFFTSSIRGGSTAIPTQKEAVVGFWDVKGEKIAWQGKPIPGTSGYGQAALGSDGLIYGLTDTKYYIINPKNREVIKVADLPVSALRYLAFHDVSAGPKGLLYGLGDDAIFAIDPKTKKATILARHESIKDARGIMITNDGTVYYGSGVELWRARPVK